MLVTKLNPTESLSSCSMFLVVEADSLVRGIEVPVPLVDSTSKMASAVEGAMPSVLLESTEGVVIIEVGTVEETVFCVEWVEAWFVAIAVLVTGLAEMDVGINVYWAQGN
eukprot:scpid103605/ scgid30149/ 